MKKKLERGILPPAPNLCFEIELWNAGTQIVAGIDEAGRGALAGPVAAAALVLPPDPGLSKTLVGVRDSKQMKPSDRQHWAGCLRDLAVDYGVGFATNGFRTW